MHEEDREDPEGLSQLVMALLRHFGLSNAEQPLQPQQKPAEQSYDEFFKQALKQTPGALAGPQQAAQSVMASAAPNIGATAGRQANLLQEAKTNIEQAYPDNPTMQKVALSQAILESNLLGKPSKLATFAKNLFGIKAPGTAGKATYATAEYGADGRRMENANFGTNRSYLDSVLQHKKLMEKSRYKDVLAAQDPIKAFQALQKSGYATDPRYAQKLSSIYRHNVEPLFK